jgi:hypothetical protein
MNLCQTWVSIRYTCTCGAHVRCIGFGWCHILNNKVEIHFIFANIEMQNSTILSWCPLASMHIFSTITRRVSNVHILFNIIHLLVYIYIDTLHWLVSLNPWSGPLLRSWHKPPLQCYPSKRKKKRRYINTMDIFLINHGALGWKYIRVWMQEKLESKIPFGGVYFWTQDLGGCTVYYVWESRAFITHPKKPLVYERLYV